jgi:hypothetical protein
MNKFELGNSLSKNIKDYYELSKSKEMTEKLKNKLDNELIELFTQIENFNGKVIIRDIRSDMFFILFKNEQDFYNGHFNIRRKNVIHYYFKILEKLRLSRKNYELCIYDGLNNSIFTKDKELMKICIPLLPDQIQNKAIFEILFFIYLLEDNSIKAENYLIQAIRKGTKAKDIFEIYKYVLDDEEKNKVLSYILNERVVLNNIDEEIKEWFYNESIGKNNYNEY